MFYLVAERNNGVMYLDEGIYSHLGGTLTFILISI